MRTTVSGKRRCRRDRMWVYENFIASLRPARVGGVCGFEAMNFATEEVEPVKMM